MDITRRCDYAFRMLRTAYQNGENYTSVSDIAKKDNIPYTFARSIQHDLVKSGLIKTIRGARGGLVLKCNPETTNLLEVLEAVQGPVNVAACSLDPESCEFHEECEYHQVWNASDLLLSNLLASITLEELYSQGGSHPVLSRIIDDNAKAFAEFLQQGISKSNSAKEDSSNKKSN